MKYILEVKEVLFFTLLEVPMNPEILEALVEHYAAVAVRGHKAQISVMPVIKTLLASGVRADWLKDVSHFAIFPIGEKRPEMAFPTDSYA